MSIVDSVTSLIGQTPLLRLAKLDTGPCELLLKLENQNPGGSIKDRVALSMINEAERQGRLAPGGTIIEATAGNTGLGLALIAAQKGYRLILVVPDKMSREKIYHLRALGVDVRLTRSDVNKGHPAYYQDYAQRLADETPGAFYIDQFNNPPTRWRIRPPPRRSFLRRRKGALTLSWWALAPAARSAGFRPGFASTLPTLNSCSPIRQDRSWPIRLKRGAITRRDRGWWRASARISFRRSRISRASGRLFG
ncbi:Cysteine synthase [Cronobacter sakazakii]|nr:Cysteine synthase [Cronobacter sakazakii]